MDVVFQVGQLVNVAAQTGPNENKPGGVGKIISVEDDGTYSVKYVLGGRESGVNPIHIKPHEFENPRTRGRRSSTDGGGGSETGTSKQPKPACEDEIDQSQTLIEKSPAKPKTSTVESKSPKKNMPTNSGETKALSSTTSPIRQQVKAKMTSKIIAFAEDDEENGERNEEMDRTTESTRVIVVPKQAESPVENVDDDQLKLFNQELRRRFGQEDQLELQNALSILDDASISMKMLRVLADQNRIYLDQQSDTIWKM